DPDLDQAHDDGGGAVALALLVARAVGVAQLVVGRGPGVDAGALARDVLQIHELDLRRAQLAVGAVRVVLALATEIAVEQPAEVDDLGAVQAVAADVVALAHLALGPVAAAEVGPGEGAVASVGAVGI